MTFDDVSLPSHPPGTEVINGEQLMSGMNTRRAPSKGLAGSSDRLAKRPAKSESLSPLAHSQLAEPWIAAFPWETANRWTGIFLPLCKAGSPPASLRLQKNEHS